MLTIVVPVRWLGEISEEWHKQIKYPLIIIEELNLPLSMARKLGIFKVKTKYILNLDSDTVLPEGYIERALKILEENEDVAVIAIDYQYPHCQGHLAFGTSIWRTDFLKECYDWTEGTRKCECSYMWIKVRRKGLRIETLPMRAIHLKGKQKFS